jgi:hypothetical protein
MPVIGNDALTLSDLATRSQDGKLSDIVELLSVDNEILMDMLWLEANERTAHTTTTRTGLPAVFWRMMNQGVPSTKSTTAQIKEPCAELTARAQVDEKLVNLSKDPARFRLGEAAAFVEAMSQEMASTLFYGAASSPNEFVGLANRYSARSGVPSAENIIHGGGSGSDNTSIWLVQWGDRSFHGIYPQGSKAGLEHQDMGVELVDDGSGTSAMFRAYRDYFSWNCGIALRDWRYVVRVANIDVSNLIAESSATDILKAMTKAVHKLPKSGQGRKVFYVNRTVLTMLDIQAQNKVNVYLNVGQEEGQPKLSFRGIPIRCCDAILNTEATVS